MTSIKLLRVSTLGFQPQEGFYKKEIQVQRGDLSIIRPH